MTQENAMSLARLLVEFLETGNGPDGGRSGVARRASYHLSDRDS
jgi:hypothetical protein